MIAATLSEQKKAKLKFFAAYALSVTIILFIFAALWRDHPSTAETAIAQPAPPSNEKFVQSNAMLQAQLQGLDSLSLLLVSSNEKGGDKLKAVQEAQAGLQTTLDGVSKDAASVTDESQRRQLDEMVAGYKKMADNNKALVSNYVRIINDTTRTVVTNAPVQNSGKNDAAMQELKAMLVEKEQRITAMEQQGQKELADKNNTIASLQGQLKQAQNSRQTVVTAPQTTGGGDAETKQKLAKLKSVNDNLSSQNATLNNAYKALVEDNRRLLSQIQSMRKQ